jgi:hypothetical protein
VTSAVSLFIWVALSAGLRNSTLMLMRKKKKRLKDLRLMMTMEMKRLRLEKLQRKL